MDCIGKLPNSLSLPINALLSNKYNLSPPQFHSLSLSPHSVSFLYSSSPSCVTMHILELHSPKNLNFEHWRAMGPHSPSLPLRDH